MSRQPMFAILSDIHANLEALRVVLDDVSNRGIRHVHCLGDSVGYGPDPEPCLSMVQNFDIVLRGNFDDQVLSDDPDTIPQLRELARWTRGRLSPASRAFLAACPARHSFDVCTYSHGSPLDNDYLFPEDSFNSRKMKRVFEQFEGVFFCGHSHIAGVHTLDEFGAPETIDYEYVLDGNDVLINVGSVGQPRDGDRRACYVVVDGELVRFVRLDYDIDATIRKLRDNGFGPAYWGV